MKARWSGEVEKETVNYIGKEYVLVYYFLKPNRKEHSIELGGTNYFLIKQSLDEFKHTKITEIVEVIREKEQSLTFYL